MEEDKLFIMPEEQKLEAVLGLQPTPPQPVAPTAPKIRLEFYDNLNRPGFGEKKRYGLLIDVNNSKERFNLNFGIRKPETLWKYKESAKATREEYLNLEAMYQLWKQSAKQDELHVTVAWQNMLSGTGKYDFGNKLHYRVGAILLPNPHFAPWVVLFVDGAELVVPSDWNATPHSTSPFKKYEVRF